MKATSSVNGLRSESGAVLIFVLIISLLLNIVSSSVIQSATLQTRMAGNDYAYVESMHLAQSLGSSLILDLNNFPLSQAVGEINCLPYDLSSDCGNNSLALSPSMISIDHSRYRALVTRVAPDVLVGERVVTATDGTPSSVPLEVALFEIEVQVMDSANTAQSAGAFTGVVVPLDGGTHWRSYQRETGIDAL